VSAHNRQRQNTVNHVNIVGDYRASTTNRPRGRHLRPGTEGLGNAAMILVLLIGGHMVLRGQMEVGELTGFAWPSPLLRTDPALAQLYNTYQQGKSGLVKLRELLQIEPAAGGAGAEDLPPSTATSSSTTSLRYDPPSRSARRVARCAAGETYSLVGATGAGKSTIAKL